MHLIKKKLSKKALKDYATISITRVLSNIITMQAVLDKGKLKIAA